MSVKLGEIQKLYYKYKCDDMMLSFCNTLRALIHQHGAIGNLSVVINANDFIDNYEQHITGSKKDVYTYFESIVCEIKAMEIPTNFLTNGIVLLQAAQALRTAATDYCIVYHNVKGDTKEVPVKYNGSIARYLTREDMHSNKPRNRSIEFKKFLEEN